MDMMALALNVVKQDFTPPFQQTYLLQTQSLNGGTYFFLEINNRKSEVKKLIIK